MKSKIFVIILGVLLISSGFAKAESSVQPEPIRLANKLENEKQATPQKETINVQKIKTGDDEKLPDQESLYFNKKEPHLTQKEETGLRIAQKWDKSGMKPLKGKSGAINYLYGAERPSIVCAVLQICDVSLQQGERVNNIELGDTTRWTVSPALSGSGNEQIEHLIIKPMDVGLKTSLVITTDRRTYHFRLTSTRHRYMPSVTFSYPEEALKKWKAFEIRKRREYSEKTLPRTGEYLGNLKFNYDITGDAPWKPVRVYNDGVKTVIQMPSEIQKTEAPTLLVVRKNGYGSYDDDNPMMVNYRVQGDRYIVDMVFDRAILIAGVGQDQDKITVTRR